MEFNVSQLLKEPSGSRRVFKISENVIISEGQPESRIKCTVDMLRTPSGILVTSAIQTTVNSNCSRCLTRSDESVNVDLEEEFIPTLDVLTGTEVDNFEELGENYRIDKNHILDLQDTIRDYVSMATPMKPICNENCSGICVTCGSNQNETICTCKQQQRDIRWDPLLKLSESSTN